MITSLLRRLQWLLLSILCLQVILAAPVQAHPLGNFTINQYTGFQISEHQLQINYVLDMAEIPAFQEIQTLDLDHNRRVDPEEIQDYPERTCQQLQSDLKVYRDQPADRILLSLKTADLAFPPGVGGLATLRLTCHYYGVLGSLNSSTDLHIDNQIYAHRLGWREITVMSDSIPIQSPFGSDSLSHQLTVYPDDLLSSPLDQREATLTLFPEIGSGNSPSAATAVSGPSLAGRSGDLMTDLLTLKHLTPITMLGALILAFVWGGFHALTPGHGKTLVGAYLVGSKGTPRHAICLGLTTTLAHTSSVFLLGLIALIASQFLITEALYPWLSLISGGMIVGVGLYLFRQRLQDLDHSHSHHHDHSHSHHHDHHHPHGHHYPHGHHHPHDHHHPHGHHHDHHHAPPDSIRWSSLVAIGLSGGVLPCPSALLVMLGSVTLGRIGFGMALVLAFSCGLAAVLTGIGLLFVYARKRVERSSLRLPQWRGWTAVSALWVCLIGLGMTGQAIVQLL